MNSAHKLKRFRNVPANHSYRNRSELINVKFCEKHIFNEYYVLMPGLHDLPGAVGDSTLNLLKSLRVKVAEALPAEIAAAMHQKTNDSRYAVANATKAAFQPCKQNDDADTRESSWKMVVSPMTFQLY